MKIKKIIAIILSIFLCLCFSSCSQKQLTEKAMRTNMYFGTNTQIVVYDNFELSENEDKFDKMWKSAKEILKEIDEKTSATKDGSDIYKFNQLSFGESVEISAVTAEVFMIAQEAYELTQGKFNPCIYPLVDLWGFTPRFNQSDFEKKQAYDRDYNGRVMTPPDIEYIESFKKLVDFENIILKEQDGKFYLEKNIASVIVENQTYEAKIDLGGIGKGYAVEKINELLTDSGYQFGFVSSGTSSMAILEKYDAKNDVGTPYSLGVRKPREGKETNLTTFLQMDVSNILLSSSGDYEHFYEFEGKRYCHIIDPETGYPMNATNTNENECVATVTIIGQSGALFDALTTAVCLMNVDEALNFLNENNLDYVLTTYQNGDILGEKYGLKVYTNIKSAKIVDEAYTMA